MTNPINALIDDHLEDRIRASFPNGHSVFVSADAVKTSSAHVDEAMLPLIEQVQGVVSAITPGRTGMWFSLDGSGDKVAGEFVIEPARLDSKDRLPENALARVVIPFGQRMEPTRIALARLCTINYTSEVELLMAMDDPTDFVTKAAPGEAKSILEAISFLGYEIQPPTSNGMTVRFEELILKATA